MSGGLDQTAEKLRLSAVEPRQDVRFLSFRSIWRRFEPLLASGAERCRDDEMLLALLLAIQASQTPAVTAPAAKPTYRAHRAPDCGLWRVARSGRGATPVMEAIVNYWFRGYATAFNAHGFDRTGDLLGTTKWSEIGAFIDDHCARNPSGSIVDALEPLAEQLIARRPPPIVSPGPKRLATMSVTETCADWARARKDKILGLAFDGAALGYLTGYNRWEPDPRGDLLAPGNESLVFKWIDRWCGKRPAVPMLAAMPYFIKHAAAERAAGRLAPGKTPGNEAVIPTKPGRR